MVGFVPDLPSWVKTGFACGGASHGQIPQTDIDAHHLRQLGRGRIRHGDR